MCSVQCGTWNEQLQWQCALCCVKCAVCSVQCGAWNEQLRWQCAVCSVQYSFPGHLCTTECIISLTQYTTRQITAVKAGACIYPLVGCSFHITLPTCIASLYRTPYNCIFQHVLYIPHQNRAFYNIRKNSNLTFIWQLCHHRPILEIRSLPRSLHKTWKWVFFFGWSKSVFFLII